MDKRGNSYFAVNNSKENQKAMEELIRLEKELNQLRRHMQPEDETFRLFVKLNEEAKNIGLQINETPPTFPTVESREIFPCNDVISRLMDFIEMMKKEKAFRTKKVEDLRKKATDLLETLKISPSTDHERFILYFEDILSKNLIEELTDFIDSLEDKVLLAEAERQELCGEIESLTRSFGDPPCKLPMGISGDTIKLLKSKAAQLLERRRDNIETLVANAVTKINNYKTYLLISEKTKKPEVSSEETLNRLQVEILKLKKYHEDHKEMIELIHKRWKDRETLLDLEQKSVRQVTSGTENYDDEFMKWDLKNAIKKDEETLKKWNGKVHGQPIDEMIEQENISFKNKLENAKNRKRRRNAHDPDEIEIIAVQNLTAPLPKKKFYTNPSNYSVPQVSVTRRTFGQMNSLNSARPRCTRRENESDSEDEISEVTPIIDNDPTGFGKGRKRNFNWKDDFKMLKIIGASKWHGYTNECTIWEEMSRNCLGFPDKKPMDLKRRFHEIILENLSSYGLSRRELELYAIGGRKKNKGHHPIWPNTPFNPKFDKYKLD